MRAVRIFFFSKIFFDDLPQVAIRARRQYPEMRREGFHVTIILGSVQLQGFAIEFSSLPILIKRVLEQILGRNSGIQTGKQFAVGHFKSSQASGTRKARREGRHIKRVAL